MPILIALLAIIGGVWFWIQRARQAGRAVEDIAGLVGDAASAARRFSYRRRANEHPAEGIDDHRVAGAGLLFLAAADEGPVTQAEETEILRQLQSGYGVLLDEARELLTLARWLADPSRGPDEMARLLVRRYAQLGAPRDVEILAGMLTSVGAVGDAAGAEDIIHRLARAQR